MFDITAYGKNPTNKYTLLDASISYEEKNAICGDSVIIFLKIEDAKIQDFSFMGETSLVTSACTSMFGESIIDMSISEVFTLDESYIKETLGIIVSPRRQQASLLWLLATRNAIHVYLWDGKKDDFWNIVSIQ